MSISRKKRTSIPRKNKTVSRPNVKYSSSNLSKEDELVQFTQCVALLSVLETKIGEQLEAGNLSQKLKYASKNAQQEYEKYLKTLFNHYDKLSQGDNPQLRDLATLNATKITILTERIERTLDYQVLYTKEDRINLLNIVLKKAFLNIFADFKFEGNRENAIRLGEYRRKRVEEIIFGINKFSILDF
jgi:hypothetical protein